MRMRWLATAPVLFLMIACAPVTEPAQEVGPVETAAEGAEQIPAAADMECSGVLTSPDQEGPYYSPGSPERASLVEEGMPGSPVVISGRVLAEDCTPIGQARVDFWQADAYGAYDNAGYRLRGHVVTGADGSYSLETIAPGLYTGRPPHIHVKVFAADGRELLTTQMYFPGSEQSADVQAAPDLLATYAEPDQNGREQVVFDFVVQD